MNRFYVFGAVFLTAAVLIFAMQNLHVATVEFILWEIDTPVSLVALVSFLAGIVIGWLSGRFRKRRKPKEKIPQVVGQQVLGPGAAMTQESTEQPVEESPTERTDAQP